MPALCFFLFYYATCIKNAHLIVDVPTCVLFSVICSGTVLHRTYLIFTKQTCMYLYLTISLRFYEMFYLSLGLLCTNENEVISPSDESMTCNNVIKYWVSLKMQPVTFQCYGWFLLDFFFFFNKIDVCSITLEIKFFIKASVYVMNTLACRTQVVCNVESFNHWETNLLSLTGCNVFFTPTLTVFCKEELWEHFGKIQK